MHGDKSQSQRQKALARFDRGETPVLVATDVAARGIDVPEISHVVQFDAPEDGDTYTHRAGRTGRAGSTGHAVSFVLDDQAHELRGMAKGLGLSGEFDRREGAHLGGSQAEHRGGRDHNHNRGGGGRTHPKGGSGGGSNRNRRQRGARRRSAPSARFAPRSGVSPRPCREGAISTRTRMKAVEAG